MESVKAYALLRYYGLFLDKVMSFRIFYFDFLFGMASFEIWQYCTEVFALLKDFEISLSFSRIILTTAFH
jgi:hypothetical protein